jgi:hypothetical protein
MLEPDYQLHRLGWKAFQDLCVAIVEERLQRPVQTFLPSRDAGRDGAFVGLWDSQEAGESTIQCKFTSHNDKRLTPSLLRDELPKAKRLAMKGLADDYILLTNYTITGESELAIRRAFESNGIKRCRVYHRDWIIQRIVDSPRLRMMMPRLYGLIDLSVVLDDRAYRQAQLILSEMGDNLRKLVVTKAYKRSVEAVSKHNLVLLLGSPATGKSTIGASLALGANDTWGCRTIKSTSPQHLEEHLDPNGGQFFWIDDAWGSTQYQRERTEPWNQIFPLMQGAMRRGTRFLITSRDYIWNEAKKELKIPNLPILGNSQVIIDVKELSLEERTRILYNHVKLGDQSIEFRAEIKPLLPALTMNEDFLPESSRRLGNRLFTTQLQTTADGLADFFSRPKEFLEPIESLSNENQAAIALIFMHGGSVRSPVPTDILSKPATAFGTTAASLRPRLQALNGSLLNLAEDEEGPYWTYRHPTISDAFASHIAKSTELVEIYLNGAKPETIVREVVCAGKPLRGASVVVPNSFTDLLLDRIASLPSHTLASFVSYRSNILFTQALIAIRPDVFRRIELIGSPIKDDSDCDLLLTLHQQKLLPEDCRIAFVESLRTALIDEADDSFIASDEIAALLSEEERADLLDAVRTHVMPNVDLYISRTRSHWNNDYDPNSHFAELRESLKRLAKAISDTQHEKLYKKYVDTKIDEAINFLEAEYDPPTPTESPRQQSDPIADSLGDIFRDVDE